MSTIPNTPWVNGKDGNTPLNAERLNNIEDRVNDKVDRAVADSLYAPIGSVDPASLVVTSGNMAVVLGTPVQSISARTVLWLMDPSKNESVGGVCAPPLSWSTMNVDLLWCNFGPNSGDASWRFDYSPIVTDSLAPDPAAGQIVTAVAGLQGVVIQTRLASGLPRKGEVGAYEVVRLGSDPGDTLTNDAGLIGIILRKAS